MKKIDLDPGIASVLKRLLKATRNRKPFIECGIEYTFRHLADDIDVFINYMAFEEQKHGEQVQLTLASKPK